MASRFNFAGFLWRWVAALALVLLTFNPSGFSYAHWLTAPEGGDWPLKVVVGIVLIVGYVIYIRATWRSIGPIGVALAVGFFAALIWVGIDYGLLSLEQTTLMTYVVLVVIATVMAIGLSWSHVRRRLSGQADVDDVDA